MLRLAPLLELGVVTERDEHEMGREQRRDQDREQEHVGDVHARPERRLPGERGSPDERREVGADERNRHRDRVTDRKAHARQQVVGERVAEVSLEQRDRQHRQPDVVREVPRLAERAGEEDAHEMKDDCGDEDIRGPVVRLPDEQSGLHLHRDVDDRLVRGRHLLTSQRGVRAVVDDVARDARVE